METKDPVVKMAPVEVVAKGEHVTVKVTHSMVTGQIELNLSTVIRWIMDKLFTKKDKHNATQAEN